MEKSDRLGLDAATVSSFRLTDFTANGTCTFGRARPVRKAAAPTSLPLPIRFDATEVSWQAVRIVSDAEDTGFVLQSADSPSVVEAKRRQRIAALKNFMMLYGTWRGRDLYSVGRSKDATCEVFL
jgi:hypothetical protein